VAPEVRAQILAWLIKRPNDAWFYARSDNCYSARPPLKQWLMSAL
jgi:hypothetical protein